MNTSRKDMMGYKRIDLKLTDEQLADIKAVVDETVDKDRPFALLAQPHVRGTQTGKLIIYVLTRQQYAVIDAAIAEAATMDKWESK